MAKNPTAWFPQSGLGYVVPQLGLYLQDNLGNNIIDNLGNFFVPNPYYVIGKYATLWSQV
jgi:hypothetical protein